jgi:hypothetical protein
MLEKILLAKCIRIVGKMTAGRLSEGDEITRGRVE